MEHTHRSNNHEHAGHQGDHNHEQGHDQHQGHSTAMFRNKFFISLILTIPVLALSPLMQQFVGFELSFRGDKYLLFALATAVFFYGGWPFLSGAGGELKRRNPGMMTLIGLAIVVAYVYSSAVVFGLAGKFFFWELVTLIDIMLLGHWIEMRSVMGASMALKKLSALIPDNAHLLKGGEIKEIPTSELNTGHMILVKPGEKIPADGVVQKGEGYVDESMLTGESRPAAKSGGDEVIAGSVNQQGSLEVEVAGVGDDSYLSKVIRLVREAQSSKSKTQALADKAAFWLTIIAILAGSLTFASWFYVNGELAFAIERMATVLVITCPHALGLAIPLVVAVSTTQAARNGLLIRNRTVFENARNISTVVFDKTGTLTDGAFGVKDITPIDKEQDKDRLLSLFAGLERHSEHPIAAAIMQAAGERSLDVPEASNFQAIKGKGVEGSVNDEKITIAGPGYIQELGLGGSEDLQRTGGTTVFLVKGEQDKILLGALNLSDSIRKESYVAVNRLKQAGIKTWLLTGDNKEAAKSVAEELGMNGYFAGVLPEEKQDKIKELQGRGEFVAMVGDGINDAPALAQANVGIAIGSGTDVAAETADIILVNSDPGDVSVLINFGRATYRKILENLAWAAGYNIFAIPLAAGALVSFGILLSPAFGAILMSLSTVIVAVNAKTLRLRS